MSLPDEIRDLAARLTGQGAAGQEAAGFDWEGFRRVMDELVGSWLQQFPEEKQQEIVQSWSDYYEQVLARTESR